MHYDMNLISYSLHFLMYFYYRKGNTFDSYVSLKQFMNQYCFGLAGNSFLQKSTFIKVVLAFIELIDTKSLPLTCILCGPYPKWLSFDGVSLAMHKENVLWDKVDTIFPQHGDPVALGPEVLKQRDRILLQNRATRALLNQFCKAEPQPLTEEEFTTLTNSLQTECSPLAQILEELHSREKHRRGAMKVTMFSFPGPWKDFFKVLSTPTSMTWILRPAIVPMLLHVLHNKRYTEDAHHHLCNFCPPLASALAALPDGILQDVHINLRQ